jgi:hypothetical protein
MRRTCRGTKWAPNPENTICGHGRLMWLGVVMAFRKGGPRSAGGHWGTEIGGLGFSPRAGLTFVENLSKRT